MRAVRVVIAVLLLIGIGVAVWLATPNEPTQTVVLPDGSKLTLIKVTRGPRHSCRYDNRWQDLLAPVLPQKLRAKFSPRILTFTSSDTNAVMVWFRHDGAIPRSGWPPAYSLATAGANDLESRLYQSANVSAVLAGKATARSEVNGWELTEYPRLAREFSLRIYVRRGEYDLSRVAEFKIKGAPRYPLFSSTAGALPLARSTNGLEVALLKLETGFTTKESGMGPAPKEAKAFSRATFSMKENGAASEGWEVHRIQFASVSGEGRPGGSYSSRWSRGQHSVDVPGALWLDEPAWKLNVALSRSTNFPPEETWTITNVSVPRPGELSSQSYVTNIHNIEFGFTGVSGARAKLPEGYTAMGPYANLHFRAPYPAENIRVRLLSITDDQGRLARLHGSSSSSYLGGRTTMPKEMIYGFGFEVPEDAKSLDVTFAVTKVVTVEFVAKPTLAK